MPRGDEENGCPMMKRLSDILPHLGGPTETESYSKVPVKTVGILDFLSLIGAWPRIAGDLLAKHTVPLKLQGSTLIILTRHPAFSHQLGLMSEELKGQIAKVLPSYGRLIKTLRFQTSTPLFEEMDKRKSTTQGDSSPKQRPRLHPQSPEYKRMRKEAESFFKEETDNDIRELFIKLSLQRRQEEN
jgi:hypothetical protein